LNPISLTHLFCPRYLRVQKQHRFPSWFIKPSNDKFAIITGGIVQITVIISGGQSGVDRAAFDVALAWGVLLGGWVPRGRLDEFGTIDPKYPNLREAESDDPAVRTFLNVRDSDGTLMISRGPLLGGSCHAIKSAHQLFRPLCLIDLSTDSLPKCIEKAVYWIHYNKIQRLNVGGPRESEDPEIYGYSVQLMSGVLARLFQEDSRV
jgi:hypothetical protein